MTNKTKITVVGSGYVGLSLAVLLAQHNEVVVLDIDSKRVDLINNKRSTVSDREIENFLLKKELNLRATLDKYDAYDQADYIVIATPTNYDPDTNCFDTSVVDSVIKDSLEFNADAFVVIKSTIPIGHTKILQEKHNTKNIIYSPEFLREGQALKDNLYPSRIIIGSLLDHGKKFASLLLNSAEKKDIEIIFTNSTEAEAVKLFSNTYLAMRVSFFNELDTFALSSGLDTKSIINGVCLDKRIGDGYNNPSFGYGGYCLPKDTKQLLSNYDQIPQNLIEAVVSSNTTRKDFLADHILSLSPKIVGIYRLVMKQGSNNHRSSAIKGIIKRIKEKGVKVVIFEPSFKDINFFGSSVINDINQFIKISDLILANRISDDLAGFESKVFTRDIFREN